MRANLIAGQWTAGKQTNPDINPSDVSDVIDQYASGDAAAVDAAVAAARAAFPAWSVSTPQQRFDALDFAGSEILARRAELGELLAREEGKTLAEATGEAAREQLAQLRAAREDLAAGEIERVETLLRRGDGPGRRSEERRVGKESRSRW